MNPFIPSFVKQGGEVARDLRLMSDAQISTITFGQALIDTAKNNGVDLGNPAQLFKSHNSLPALQQLAQSKGLDVGQINNLAQSFDRGQWPKHAPKFMNIADMAAILPKAASNTLLGAQAAARIAENTENIKNGVRSNESLAQTLDKSNKRNQVKGWQGEPEYIEAAQSAEHMARVMAAAISEDTSLAKKADVQRAITAMELLSGQSFKQAAKDAEKQGVASAAQKMKSARAAQRDDVNVFSKYSSTSTLLSKVEKGMAAIAQANPQYASQIKKLMAERKSQIQKLNVVGSLVAPDALFDKGKGSFVDRLNSEGRGGGGRGF